MWVVGHKLETLNDGVPNGLLACFHVELKKKKRL